MDENSEKTQLYEKLNETPIVASLKSQLKQTLINKLRNRVSLSSKRTIDEKCNLLYNIILEYLIACGFQNSASIFFSESSMYQISKKDIYNAVSIPKSPITTAENLLSIQNYPSIMTQTTNEDVDAKLQEIDSMFRLKRSEDRQKSIENHLMNGISDIEKEIEDRFNEEMKKRLSMFRASELAAYVTSETASNNQNLNILRREMEQNLKEKTTELKIKHLRNTESIRVKQRELELEIGKWAEKNVENVIAEHQSQEAIEISKKCEYKIKKLEAKAHVLEQKIEQDLRNIEDEKLEHRKTKRQIEKLELSLKVLEGMM